MPPLFCDVSRGACRWRSFSAQPEVCGGGHDWARQFQKLGHEVRIMPPAQVKPYVKRNKNNGRDAEEFARRWTAGYMTAPDPVGELADRGPSKHDQ
jgi:transposase